MKKYRRGDSVWVKRERDVRLAGTVSHYVGGHSYMVFVAGQGPQIVDEWDLSPRTDEEESGDVQAAEKPS